MLGPNRTLPGREVQRWVWSWRARLSSGSAWAIKERRTGPEEGVGISVNKLSTSLWAGTLCDWAGYWAGVCGRVSRAPPN